MFSFKGLKDRLTQAWTHHLMMRKARPIAQRFLDLAAWSLMVEDRVLAERLGVPKAVGGFEAYDALIAVPLGDVSPKAIRGLHAFVIRGAHALPASQREELHESFKAVVRLFQERKAESAPKLRLVHSR